MRPLVWLLRAPIGVARGGRAHTAVLARRGGCAAEGGEVRARCPHALRSSRQLPWALPLAASGCGAPLARCRRCRRAGTHRFSPFFLPTSPVSSYADSSPSAGGALQAVQPAVCVPSMQRSAPRGSSVGRASRCVKPPGVAPLPGLASSQAPAASSNMPPPSSSASVFGESAPSTSSAVPLTSSSAGRAAHPRGGRICPRPAGRLRALLRLADAVSGAREPPSARAWCAWAVRGAGRTAWEREVQDGPSHVCARARWRLGGQKPTNCTGRIFIIALEALCHFCDGCNPFKRCLQVRTRRDARVPAPRGREAAQPAPAPPGPATAAVTAWQARAAVPKREQPYSPLGAASSPLRSGPGAAPPCSSAAWAEWARASAMSGSCGD